MIATGFRRGWGEKHRLKNTLKGDEMYEKGKYLAEPGWKWNLYTYWNPRRLNLFK